MAKRERAHTNGSVCQREKGVRSLQRDSVEAWKRGSKAAATLQLFNPSTLQRLPPLQFGLGSAGLSGGGVPAPPISAEGEMAVCAASA